jgi:hypothetical protein
MNENNYEYFKNKTIDQIDKLKLAKLILDEHIKICQNVFKWFSNRNMLLLLFSFDITHNDINTKTNKQLLNIIFDKIYNVDTICPYCKNKKIFVTFKVGYTVTCTSASCISKNISERMSGNNNSYHKLSKYRKLQLHKKQSTSMKSLILNGLFTPPITNSWANSKAKIRVNDCDYKFRSTWEAFIWLLHPHLLYEKIRIPYIDENNNNHVYIVDFVDEHKHILYEIKPQRCTKLPRNIQKEIYAKKWCYSHIVHLVEKYFILWYNVVINNIIGI